jgi:uracil-DNA glycosylase
MSNSSINPEIEESWKNLLTEEFNSTYFNGLKNFLIQEKQTQKIYPAGKDIFNAFNLTPFTSVKVVIIGQDPYHGEGQAHGLCFSVNKGVPQPPSLINIFKEIQNDLGISPPQHGDLSSWAKQGVLLLNATLTVRANQAGSHQNKGWEKFTDAVIKKISSEKEGIVFLLWGGFAKKKELIIDTKKHHVLTCGHPSPLSANKGHWFGNKHFSKTNEILKTLKKNEINWKLE